MKTDATSPLFEDLEASKEEDAGLEKENGIPGTLRGKEKGVLEKILAV